MSERGPARVPPQVRMLAEVNAFEPEPGRQPPPRPRWTGWFCGGHWAPDHGMSACNLCVVGSFSAGPLRSLGRPWVE